MTEMLGSTTRSQTPNRMRQRRGAVLIEFVMCIPLLGLVTAAIFFFGWAMMNQQHVRVSDRYATWRSLYGWQEYKSEDGNSLHPHEILDLLFFRDKATSVGIGGYGGVDPDSIPGMVEAAGTYGAHPENVARESVQNKFPHGRVANVSAGFKPILRIWQRLSGAIRSRHYREGVEWRRGQVSYLEVIRDLFMSELDEAARGCQLSDEIRALYLKRW